MRILLLLLTLYPMQALAEVSLWAVSDGVRVNPVTGELIEAQPKIHADYPTGDYRSGNPVWDSEAGTVSLKAARNEFTAFQLIIETDEPVEGIDVGTVELKHPDGAVLKGRNVQILKEWYVEVRRASTGYEGTSLGPAWYPDALMPKRPARLGTGFPFSIPDLYNNIPNQRNHGIWVDIYIPNERPAAPPGRYTGDVGVQWEGGEGSVHIALDVWDFALPHENHLPGDIWNGSMRHMSLEEELSYYQVARRHRFHPLIYAYRPELEVGGTNVSLDWTAYDQRVRRYLDGSAFTTEHGYWGSGYGVPITHMMLPFNVDSEKHPGGAWPIPEPNEGRTPEYEAVWKETARQIRAHLDAIPEAGKVRKISFLNGLDESYFESAYERMLYYGKLLHDGLGRGWFEYRIDGGYSREVMKKLAAEVDLLVCHSVSFDIDDVDYYRTLGVETWFYGPMIYEQRKNSGCGSNTFLDLDLLVNRAIGWVGWKYQSGWVEWEFDWNAYASWYEAENFKEPERIFNGSGQLIYRGDVMGYREPIASIRLKAQRRGLQDYEYFWLLSQTAGGKTAADALVNSVIYKKPFGEAAMLDTEIWKNNPEAWDRVRIAAGAKIAANPAP
jgi:glycosyl hydrolase family 123